MNGFEMIQAVDRSKMGGYDSEEETKMELTVGLADMNGW